MSTLWQERLVRVGWGILRWSLVLFFVLFGLLKFTPDEAHAIFPLMSNSFLLSWLTSAAGEQGASNVIGVVEVMTGIAIALRHWQPIISAYGSLAAAVALLVTLSFLFTTPGVSADPWQSGFLAKDLTLLGAALWSAGEAASARRARANP
ncbi:MAG: DUF417 family protein [Sphingomonadaceae bacterium]